jgi:hypothetical protein
MRDSRPNHVRNQPESTSEGRNFTRKLDRTGRRGFIKMLSKIGISSAAISGLTKAGLAETSGDPRDRVPFIEAYKHTNHQQVGLFIEPRM